MTNVTDVTVTNTYQTTVVRQDPDEENKDSGKAKEDEPKKLTRDEWVDGQYHGKLKDEADGSRLNFALRLKSSGGPTGQPP